MARARRHDEDELSFESVQRRAQVIRELQVTGPSSTANTDAANRSRRFPPPRGGDRQSRLETFRALVQQAAAENADGPRERALRALADAASAIGPNSTEVPSASHSASPSRSYCPARY